MVVDIDQLAREALSEEAGDEQRHIAQPLQVAVTVAGGPRLERLRQHQCQRLEACTLGRALIERLRAGEQGEQIDHVVLGLVFDRQVLFGERALERVLEELAQIRDRQHATRGMTVSHG